MKSEKISVILEFATNLKVTVSQYILLTFSDYYNFIGLYYILLLQILFSYSLNTFTLYSILLYDPKTHSKE
jgi:hypothetical protein